ncbi:MAG TPA: NAD(P)/FAD-dependent oxidoreductase [Candidatus Acidoferrales bacterium]|nr:NAD(P)/FAD-dependent oxidoreductase [Candidatus Acidoferrales bacterium]
MTSRDIIIIGAGHNGLITAFYLARAGFKPLVLETRPTVGGAATTEEFHPGFRASVLDGASGPLVPDVAKDMQLERHGAQWLEPKCRVFAPSPDGRALILHSSAADSAKRIAPFSRHDSEKYLELAKILDDARAFITGLLTMIPPDIDHPTSTDIWNLLGAGRKFRKLGKRDMQRFLRWGPMAVADFVAEFFETDLLRAAIAARGIFAVAAGPWSAGTTALLLLRACGGGLPAGAGLPDGNPIYARGGMGALSESMAAAAKQAGAEIRTSAEVERILVKDGAVTGVALKGGEEISATAVVSAADPKRTFLRLVEPVHLAPSFLGQMQHYRCQGTVARVLFALDGLPNFPALKNERDDSAALTGRIHIGPEIDYLERAFDDSKYGEFSRAPFLEAAIPSLLDPSLAPTGKHVMSVHMQYAPYNVNSRTSPVRNSPATCHSESDSRQGAAFHAEERSAAMPKARATSGGRSFSSDISGSPSSGALASEVASPANWPAQRDALRDAVVETLAQYAPDLPSKIIAARVITPLDLEETYGLTGGHIHHGELALDQLFTMRPLIGWARYRTPVRGLFLCGPGTHPGTGPTGASAFNASREILRALRR